MLELKTKKELATYAFTLSQGHELVRYRSVTYMPVDFETRVPGPTKDRTIWMPLNRDKVRMLANTQFDVLFGSDSELSSFEFMVAQTAIQEENKVDSLLVRTGEGLMELEDTGKLVPASGEFRPNYLAPMLNEDMADKARVFRVIAGWLDSEDEAHSLLHHLATCLAPGWSAVKYVLLLGEGRNGKSLLMKMLHKVIGADNVSSVTRQQISEQSPVVTDLNGKLLNLVYDGQASYLKDSGAEKTLIAGEPFGIRMLYQSAPTIVQTTGLFVEGLQREPKTGDKSTALQKRLVRYQFPNVYALDHKFERAMLTEESLGAFLSLLVDHYVGEDEVAERLAPTQRALELQLEAMFANSMGLQFLKYLEETDPLGTAGLIGLPLTDLVSKFQSWRLKENDLGTWAEPDVLALFAPLIHNERKSDRVGAKVVKVRKITAFKFEAKAFIESLEGTEDDADDDVAALVED